jgi:exo-beta-1,3-glucanase (GH17 family)
MIGETGWPRAILRRCGSQPGESAALPELRPLALERGIPYFFFEAFDEDWKTDASGVEVESHWGPEPERTMKGVRFFEEPCR